MQAVGWARIIGAGHFAVLLLPLPHAAFLPDTAKLPAFGLTGRTRAKRVVLMRHTLAAESRHEVEVKRSRFLAIAGAVQSAAMALEYIESVRVQDATHNCWAFRVGQEYRSNDDGEPGGSAGRPILAAIDGSGLDGIAVVVVRWYGGVKLGVGGLVRAYGGAAAECLRNADRVDWPALVRARISAPYDDLGAVYSACQSFALQRDAEHHRASGLELQVSLPQSDLEALKEKLRDLSRGRAQLELLDE